MLGALHGFAVVAIVIGVGAALGRSGAIGSDARSVLNGVAFHVGIPALLLVTLADTDLAEVFGRPLWVLASATAAVFAVCWLMTAVLWRRTSADATISALSASYVNAGNLGIPLSTYAFGDTVAVSVLVLFQCAVVLPFGVAAMAAECADGRTSRKRIGGILANPTIVASAVGLTMSAVDLRLPAPVLDSTELLADLAVPTVLLAFGISLCEGLPRIRSSGDLLELAVPVICKSLVMPVLAYVLGRWVFGATQDELVVITVLAALPTGQTVCAIADVHHCGERLAQQAVLVTTCASVPAIALIVAATT